MPNIQKTKTEARPSMGRTVGSGFSSSSCPSLLLPE